MRIWRLEFGLDEYDDLKTDKQWNPDEEPVALTPEELDKLGNVNPLDNTNLF